MKQTEEFLRRFRPEEHEALKKTLAYNCAEYTDAVLDLFKAILDATRLPWRRWIRMEADE